MKQLLIYLGCKYSYQKFIPLANTLKGTNILYFSDLESIEHALLQISPDAILVHYTDYGHILPAIGPGSKLDRKIPIILVTNEKGKRANSQQFYLTEDFSQTDLLKIFQSENKIDFSDKLLDLIIHHLPIAVFWKDKNLKYLGCDQIFCKDRGLDEHCNIVGLTDFDLFSKDEATRNTEIDLEVIRSGKSIINYEEKVVNADGSTDFLHKSKIPIKNDNGEVIAIIGLYEKITDQVVLQEHLRNEKHYLQMLMDNIPDTIYFKDQNSKFIRINKAQAKTLGLNSPIDGIGKSDADFFDETHAKQALLDEQELMKGGEPLINKLEHVKTPDGYKYMTATKIPLNDESGKCIGMVGLSRDVTKEHLIEKELEYEKELLNLLMNNVPDRIYFKDIESRYIRINEALCKSFGAKEQKEVIGKTDYHFFAKDIANESRFNEKKIYATGVPLINRVDKEKLQDGSDIWLSTTKVPIKNEEGEIIGLVGISRDVTSQELAKQRFQHAKEKAEEANKAKSLFLANMSHEIRTPMNGVIGMADILKRTKLDPMQMEYLDIIMNSGQTLLAIINDILDFSKIESGRMELEYAPINIRSIVEEVADIQIIHANQKSLDLLTYVDTEIPEFFIGDYVRLKQIITNLVNNAIKFTPKGEVSIFAEHLGIVNNEHEVLFKVKDSGIGIPKEHQAKLFQSFTQVDSSTTRKFGGTGLGLAICKRLVNAMKGQFTLNSEEGKGSEFSFILKFKPSEEEHEGNILFKNVPFKNLNALIVDDNKTNRKIFKEYLENWDVNVSEAVNGLDALEKLEILKADNFTFDFALIDYQMDGMDGMELATKIKENPILASTRLILLSSVTDAIQGKKIKKSGFDNYLNKPVKLKHLYNAIASVIGSPNQVATNKDDIELLKADFKDKRIMIVEDNRINMKVAIHSLKPFCSNILEAYDGKEAVDLFKTEKIDYILMDIQLPVMNGIEATIIIREMEKSQEIEHPVKIIAMTANTMREDVEHCLNVGMDAFLGKPFKVNDLINVLID